MWKGMFTANVAAIAVNRRISGSSRLSALRLPRTWNATMWLITGSAQTIETPVAATNSAPTAK
jgi:hypothetical protein